jgi:transcriptional regulator with XRE-family HTH domain
MSLRSLAAALGDTTHGHIGRIETGEREPTPELAYRIIQAIAAHLAERTAA